METLQRHGFLCPLKIIKQFSIHNQQEEQNILKVTLSHLKF